MEKVFRNQSKAHDFKQYWQGLLLIDSNILKKKNLYYVMYITTVIMYAEITKIWQEKE